ncbi:MAG: endonuclease/exonuclease/phosphatase family protein [Phycisphaerales bacterium]|nr:endonuclease/exonuclease/phosphatase family protein [Phycisphaerales bacterium]
MIGLFLGVIFALGAVPVEPDGVRVMVWNVLHGGNDVEQGAEKTLAIIREVRPDVVLMQESYDINGDRPRLGEWLAGELGWHHHQAESKHLCVLTPLTIDATFLHHEWHGVGARLTDATGRSMLAWSTWIDWRSYINHDLRDKPEITDADLLAAEHTRSSRVQQAAAIIEHLRASGQLNADVPLLVGGDWNCPSHLDWTADASRAFRNRRSLALPVSMAMQEAGFVDTFRAAHPNPVQRPGFTWSPMFRGGAPDFRGETTKPEGLERIDRLYLKNPQVGWTLQPVAGKVLPETWEDEAIAIKDRAHPSDHGAVVIDLRWTPSDSASTLGVDGDCR